MPRKKPKAEPVEQTFVMATGVAVSSPRGQDAARVVERAMIAALQEAQERGEQDPDKLRAVMNAARDKAVSGG